MRLMHRDVWDAANGETFEDAKQQAASTSVAGEVSIRASTVAAGNDFVVPDKETMVKQVERMKQVCGWHASPEHPCCALTAVGRRLRPAERQYRGPDRGWFATCGEFVGQPSSYWWTTSLITNDTDFR